MTYYRYFFLLLSIVVFVPTLLTGQQEKVQSMKLNIIHQKKGAKKDTIELHDQAAVDFNIADFLAKNSRSRIHLNGSFIGDHEFVHFGYDIAISIE